MSLWIKQVGGFFLLLLFTGQTYAAGFALIEHSASGMGTAFASGGAGAEDASTLFFNPASMGSFNKSQFSVAGHLIHPVGEFSNSSSVAATGGDLSGANGDAGIDALVPNVYWFMPIGQKVHLGMAINVPFGLTTNYNDNWIGRYHGVKSEMSTININPALSYKINSQWFLGAGFNIQRAEVSLTSAVDFGAVCVGAVGSAETCSDNYELEPQQDDGFAEISGDSLAYGWNIGAMFQPLEATRIGVSYRSGMSHTVDGTAVFTVPSNATVLTLNGLFLDSNAQASVELPASAQISASHEIVGGFTLMADVSWTGWSSFDELRVEYDSAQPDSVTTENWKDSWRVAVGGRWQQNNKLQLRGGVALDQSPVPDDQHRTPRVPGNDRLWLAAGLAYQLSSSLRFDVAYAHLFIPEGKIENTFESESVPTVRHTLSGSYESSVDIASIQMTWTY